MSTARLCDPALSLPPARADVPVAIRNFHLPTDPPTRRFVKATCSVINSARTSSWVWIFFSKYEIRSCPAEWLRPRFLLKGGCPVLEELLLAAVEDRRLDFQLIVQF